MLILLTMFGQYGLTFWSSLRGIETMCSIVGRGRPFSDSGIRAGHRFPISTWISSTRAFYCRRYISLLSNGYSVNLTFLLLTSLSGDLIAPPSLLAYSSALLASPKYRFTRPNTYSPRVH